MTSNVQPLIPPRRTAADGAAAWSLPSALSAMSSTVPRELVHRAAFAEVFITGWRRAGDAEFTVGAQWPRSHVLFAPPGAAHYDPLMVAETIRQGGMVIAHGEFGIPFGHPFLLTEIGHASTEHGLTVRDKPRELTIGFVCSDIRRKGQKVSGFRVDVVLRGDGEPMATGHAAFTSVTPRVYERLRGDRKFVSQDEGSLPVPISPASVGRCHPMEVVLAQTGGGGEWELRADTRHPTLFDHPVDHIPGMVLLEAARQAVSARANPAGFRVTSMDSVFHRYAEFGSPCLIAAEGLDDDRRAGGEERAGGGGGPECVRVTARQDDELVFVSTLRGSATS